MNAGVSDVYCGEIVLLSNLSGNQLKVLCFAATGLIAQLSAVAEMKCSWHRAYTEIFRVELFQNNAPFHTQSTYPALLAFLGWSELWWTGDRETAAHSTSSLQHWNSMAALQCTDVAAS